MTRWLAARRKGLLALLAAATVIGSSGFLHGQARLAVNTGAAAAGAALVYLVPNFRPPRPVQPRQPRQRRYPD